MRMFNPSGDEVLVDKGQVPALELAGWTKTAPEVKEEPEVVEAALEEEAAEAAGEKKSPARKKRIIKKG